MAGDTNEAPERPSGAGHTAGPGQGAEGPLALNDPATSARVMNQFVAVAWQSAQWVDEKAPDPFAILSGVAQSIGQVVGMGPERLLIQSHTLNGKGPHFSIPMGSIINVIVLDPGYTWESARP